MGGWVGCVSVHSSYSPGFLTKRSWQLVMQPQAPEGEGGNPPVINSWASWNATGPSVTRYFSICGKPAPCTNADCAMPARGMCGGCCHVHCNTHLFQCGRCGRNPYYDICVIEIHHTCIPRRLPPVPEVPHHTGPPWTIPQREPPRPTMAFGLRDLHQAVAEDDNRPENDCSATEADDGLGD